VATPPTRELADLLSHQGTQTPPEGVATQTEFAGDSTAEPDSGPPVSRAVGSRPVNRRTHVRAKRPPGRKTLATSRDDAFDKAETPGGRSSVFDSHTT
jgi:hypothetical protein